MSSRQCFGGGGSSSGAITIRSSTPQTPQRYRTLILRISPEGGGGGSEVVMERNMPIPTFQINKNSTTPPKNQMMVENAGIYLEALNDGGIGHAATFAHGLQTKASTSALKFIQEC